MKRSRFIVGLSAFIAVVAVAVALVQQPAKPVRVLSEQVEVPADGTTTIRWDPATNPAFKVNGATQCNDLRAGRLWVEAEVLPRTWFSESTDTVVLEIPGGAGAPPVVKTFNAPFDQPQRITESISCAAVFGDRVVYTARSFDRAILQHTERGSYPIVKVD